MGCHSGAPGSHTKESRGFVSINGFLVQGSIRRIWSSHRVVDGGRVHVYTAIVLGHETQLLSFGLHLHCSFAGLLVFSLRTADLERDQTKHTEQPNSQEWERFILRKERFYFFLFSLHRVGECIPGPHWDRGQHIAWQTSAGCCLSSGWPEKGGRC